MAIEKVASTKGLTASTLLKLILIGYSPFGVLLGILSLLGVRIVKFNEHVVTGIKGLLTSILILVICSLFSWLLLIIGNWLYTRFRTIDITYKTPDNPHQQTQ